MSTITKIKRPLYERDAITAAKIYADVIGVHGHIGGWIHMAHGATICQGWKSYADRLIVARRIVEKDVPVARDEDGAPIYGTRWAINWAVDRARRVVGVQITCDKPGHPDGTEFQL